MQVFQISDVIIYGTQGVFRITEIEEKTIGGVKKSYYVLKPVHDNGATIYAPTNNEAVLKKMRKLLSAEEINTLIDSMPKEETCWIPNESERREYFKQVIARGDHLELIKMIKAIYLHKNGRQASGKRLHATDERFFKDAEQLLYNEFQYVLQLENKADLLTYILSRVEKNS